MLAHASHTPTRHPNATSQPGAQTGHTMISTNDVRPGMALDLPDGLFSIVHYEHVKPGKGKAFVRMKLKNVETGQVLDRTFRADEDVPQAFIDRREHQYLYSDDLGFHFMNMDDYSQFALTPVDVGDAANFLLDGMTVILAMYQGTPIGVELPTTVELEVTYAEPAVKGNTVSGATKLVKVETGIDVQVPLFVEQGDRIKVDTRSGEYMTRV
jgi:elongation factor P